MEKKTIYVLSIGALMMGMFFGLLFKRLAPEPTPEIETQIVYEYVSAFEEEKRCKEWGGTFWIHHDQSQNTRMRCFKTFNEFDDEKYIERNLFDYKFE